MAKTRIGSALSRRALIATGMAYGALIRFGVPMPGLAQQAPAPGENQLGTPIANPGDLNQATPAPIKVKNQYTFIVAGLDTRTLDQDENSDVLMFSRVDLAAKTVRTLSVPRDLLVTYPNGGQTKINAAYNYGSKENGHDWNSGVALMSTVIQNNFQIVPDAFITTNFTGFPGVVDTFGGVTVDNPYEIIDENYPTVDLKTKNVDFPAGELYLDGENALIYCRTRHMDGDNSRTLRQQSVLQALFYKATSADVSSQIKAYVDYGRKYITTNIPPEVQAQLMTQLPTIPGENIAWGTIVDYLTGGMTDDGGWNYVPYDWNALIPHMKGWLGIP